jgi:hypothetical protein
MNHGGIAPEKLAAYRNTDYQYSFKGTDVTLRIDRHSPALAQLFAQLGQSCGTFITAYNPFGEIRDEARNEEAHLRLVAQLAELGAGPVAVGASLDSSGHWPPEKSVFAFGVGLETAKALGVAFAQDAVVWSGPNAIPRLVLLR